jgi:type I restriction-modification system DNA methylase subunit
MTQLDNIEAIEKRLWAGADNLRSNFFYARTVPCELWFLNRNKPENMRNKVLMIDARNIYRKVTRKIYDFSPEQRKIPVLQLRISLKSW